MFSKWNFSSEKPEKTGRDLFPDDEPVQFFGHRFKVVARNFFPFMGIARDGDCLGGKICLRDSLDSRILNTIARHLNFT